MTSIRTFLILVTLATLVLIIFTATFQGYRSGSNETALFLDRLLEEKIGLLSIDTVEPYSSLQTHQMYQVFSPTGQLLRASSGAPSSPLITTPNELVDVSYDGALWRALRRQSLEGSTIVMAERLTDRYTISDNIISRALVPILFSIPILALLIWLIVSFGLRHLRLLETELRHRSPQNMTALTLDSLPHELQPIMDSTNSLLHRLRSAFDREQRFAGDAAHELRTPVSALKVDVHNLGFHLSERLEELTAIDHNINRMSHIIDQLLMLYRTSSNELRAQFEPVNILTMTREVVADIYSDIARKNQEIALEGEDCWLSGHEFALQAMLKNLVDNAIKYTPEGGNIVVGITKEKAHCVISVRDTGLGIPDDLKQRVKERFYRINNPKTQAIQGCGLGLSIVDHVVGLHKGRWQIESIEGEAGTRVSAYLPVTENTDE